MRKLSLLLVLLLTSSAGFAQVSWTNGGNSTTTVNGGFYRVDNAGVSLGSSSTSWDATNSSDSGTMSGSNLGLTSFAFWVGENGNNYAANGNLKLDFSNSGGSTLSLSANTYFWDFTVPTTTTGLILGYTVLEDDNSIFSNFGFVFDGSGGLTITQTDAFDIAASSTYSLSLALNNVAAVPEPATTATLFALVAGGLAVAVRRRRRRTKIV